MPTRRSNLHDPIYTRPEGYPVVVKHADGRSTLIPGPESMRGATINCDCCTPNS